MNIRMVCSWRPWLLLSMTKALDNLNSDIQQGVIGCLNRFAADVFIAEEQLFISCGVLFC